MEIPDPTYITVAEVQEHTLVTNLATANEADIKKLIQVAEGQIDKHCGRQLHHPNDSNLARVFPREQDFARTSGGGTIEQDPDTPEIPLDVSTACLRQVEWLFVNWWANRATESTPVLHQAEQVDIGADGSYSETRRPMPDFAQASLCAQAQAALKDYVSRWAALDVTDVNAVV